MVFIQLTTRKGSKVLTNVDNITNIIDVTNTPGQRINENTRIFTNDGDCLMVEETYQDIKQKLNDSDEYGLVIKMD